MNNEYKSVEEMSVDELKAVVSLIMELDSMSETQEPERQQELVLMIQTLVRNDEAIIVESPEEEEAEETEATAEEEEVQAEEADAESAE